MEILEFKIDCKIRPTNPYILLDSGPPRALYKVNPRLILGKEWWNSRRKQAYHEFNNCCAACGAMMVKLEAHEIYKIDFKLGKVYLKDVVPCCPDCHSFIHQDLHRALLQKGTLKTSDVIRILNHGKRVLKKAGIRAKRKDPNESSIKFEDWRMVIEGLEYSPVFTNNGGG